MIQPNDIINYCIKTLQFPYANKCIHLIVAELIDLLQRSGFKDASNEMCEAIITCDDDNAIKLLELYKEQK